MTWNTRPLFPGLRTAALLLVLAQPASAAWNISGYAPQPTNIPSAGTTEVTVTGTFGNAKTGAGKKRRIALTQAGLQKFDATSAVTAWKDHQIRFRIPTTLTAGTYAVTIYSPNFGGVLVAGPQTWAFVADAARKPGGLPPSGSTLLPKTIDPGTLGPPRKATQPAGRKIKPEVAAEMRRLADDPELELEAIEPRGDEPCPGGTFSVDITVVNHGGAESISDHATFKIRTDDSPAGATAYTVPAHGSKLVKRAFAAGSQFTVDPSGERVRVMWFHLLRGSWPTQCEKYGSPNGTYCDANDQNNYLPFKIVFKPASQCGP